MAITGNVFIVTGAGSGLGAATAEMLATAGAQVVAADLCVGNDPRFAWMDCDVASESDAAAVVARAKELGRLSGLINCAGFALARRTTSVEGPHPLRLFETVIRVNLIGTFNMIRLAAQAMSANAVDEEGQRGVIINTASISAFEGQIGQVAYAASKAGVAGMTITLARDLANRGIRCCTIAPGPFETPMVTAMPEGVQALVADMPLFPNRLGRGEEFARLARAIIENPMLNGETIRLDAATRLAPA